ncbi:MAG: tetratricopeptide repeat protein [Patescibacteria group bacterium]|nr:tetratricopeptide repeat protein [Patescibacteria group bacterium]
MKKRIIKNAVFLSLALIAVAATSIKALTNSDIWLWLRVGETVVKGKIIPQQDFLSHTAWGRPWIVHGWGFGALTYLAYTIGNEIALACLRLAISLGTFLALFKRSKILKSGIPQFAAVATTGFFTISNAWMLRPHILGGFLLTFLLLTIDLYRIKNPKYILLAPILILFWANTHASLPLGLVLLFILLGSELSEDILSPQTKGSFQPLIQSKKTKLLNIAIFLSILASLVNPYGIKIYQYFFKISDTVKQNILEWLPLANFLNWENAQYFLIFLAISLLALILVATLLPTKISHWEIALTLISAYLAISALRHIVIAVLILIPLVSKNITMLTEKLRGIKRYILEALFVLLITTVGFNATKSVAKEGWGLRWDILSPQAIQFLKQNPPNGKMYNHFNFGSILLWHLYPDYKTFIDGRVDMFAPDIYKEWLAAATDENNWESIFQKYQVSWVIFPTKDIWPGLKEKVNNGSWCVVFWDDTASIILKKENNTELCSALAYNYGNPFLPEDEITNYQQIIEEYKRSIKASPYNASTHNKLGKLYGELGEFEKAENEFQEAIEKNPTYVIPYLNLASLKEREDPQQSIKILEKAIKENPQAPQPYQELSQLYRQIWGDTKKANKYLKLYQKKSSK